MAPAIQLPSFLRKDIRSESSSSDEWESVSEADLVEEEEEEDGGDGEESAGNASAVTSGDELDSGDFVSVSDDDDEDDEEGEGADDSDEAGRVEESAGDMEVSKSTGGDGDDGDDGDEIPELEPIGTPNDQPRLEARRILTERDWRRIRKIQEKLEEQAEKNSNKSVGIKRKFNEYVLKTTREAHSTQYTIHNTSPQYTVTQ